MQQVLTHSDYLKLKNEGRLKNPPTINAEIIEEKRAEVLAESNFECVMAHPDRQRGMFSNNGTYNLNGEKLEMENGIVKVSDEQRIQLESQGFIFLYRKEKGVDNE